MKRILVATDGSVSSTEAVQFGVELAAEHDAELIFVHVVPVLDVVPSTGFGLSGAFPHEPTKADRALLDDAAAVAMEHGVVSTTALIRGETVDEIVAYADAHDVDVIVVGSRGRGAMTATLLGSVSGGVLRRARRPVVIVRAGALVSRPVPAAEAAR
jgi:nucleotide-binding universal stress UspA family protein